MDSFQGQETSASLSLKEILSLLVRRSWIFVAIMALTLGVTWFITKNTKKMWTASATIIMVPRPTNLLGENSLSGAFAPPPEAVETQVTLLQSPEMIDRTLREIHRENEATRTRGREDAMIPVPTYQQLVDRLSVVNPKQTELINISVDGDSKRHSEQLTQAAAQAFINWKRSIAQQQFQDTLASLHIRNGKAEKNYQHAQKALLDFKQQHQFVQVSVEIGNRLQRYLRQNELIGELRQSLAAQQARKQLAQSRLNKTNKALAQGQMVRDDAQVLGLQNRLEDLSRQREAAALVYTDKFPGILPNLDAQIGSTRLKLQEAIRATLDDKRPSLPQQAEELRGYSVAVADENYLQARLDAVIQLRDRLQKEIRTIPTTEIAYGQLQREADNTRNLRDTLIGTINQMDVALNSVAPNVLIAQDAYSPDDPSRPNLLRNYLFGSIIGLLLSLVTVILLENTDQRMRSASQARSLLPGPVIGTLPKLSQKKLRVLAAGQAADATSESYSLARANLGLALRSIEHNGAGQVVMVTSAVPGEGKSITAAALARSAARAGRSVILVNADMRHPTLNTLFNTNEPIGLADVLIGRTSLDDALVASDTENLTILHSGAPDRTPSDLIAQPRMTEVMDALRHEAELVILDTPPCSVVADALVIAPFADCILQVVSLGMADRNTVTDTVEALRTAEPKVIAFFINRAPVERPRIYGKYDFYAGNGGHGAGRNGADHNGKNGAAPTEAPALPQPEPTGSELADRSSNETSNPGSDRT